MAGSGRNTSSSGSQEFDWTEYALELAPYSSYLDFYAAQPKVFMFQGASLIDNVILIATVPLTLFWIIFLARVDFSILKELLMVGVVHIIFNLIGRTYKTLLINLYPYPPDLALMVGAYWEVMFSYTLHLQFTSTVLFYMIFRQYNVQSRMARWGYFLIQLFWFPLCFLNVQFNKQLFSLPFYLYVVTFVGFSFSNIVLMIMILSACRPFAGEKKFTRTRLFLSIFIAWPPIIFNTIITIMDLLFMVVSVTSQFPIPYLIMIDYRYKAYQVTPIFILLSYFALIPDFKRTTFIKTTTSDVHTEAISHYSDNKSQKTGNQTTETSVVETMSLPGGVVSTTPEYTPSAPNAQTNTTSGYYYTNQAQSEINSHHFYHHTQHPVHQTTHTNLVGTVASPNYPSETTVQPGPISHTYTTLQPVHQTTQNNLVGTVSTPGNVLLPTSTYPQPSSVSEPTVQTGPISHTQTIQQPVYQTTRTDLIGTVSLKANPVAPNYIPTPPSILNTPMPTSGTFPTNNSSYGGNVTVYVAPLRY